MGYYGRHRVYLLIVPWDYRPFNVTSDLIQIGISKSADSGSQCRFSLFPRYVQIGVDAFGAIQRDENYGYADVIKPNDWVFAWVDYSTQELPEPLFLGFVDRVSTPDSLSPEGEHELSVSVSCSGWEKAVENSIALAHPYIARQINIATLTELGPAGTATGDPDIGTHPSDLVTSGSTVQLFSRRIPDIIEWLLHKFLASDSSVGVPDPSSAITDASSVASGVVGGDDPSERVDEVTSIMGQFHFPQSDVPLWGLIKLAFEDMDQRIYINPTMFLNQTNVSLSNMIDQYANTTMNALIYDVRRLSNPGLSDLNLRADIIGGYSTVNYASFISTASEVSSVLAQLAQDVAPHLILRQRPLFAEEISALDGPVMDEKEFSSLDVGPSDVDLHNMTIIDTPSVNNMSTARLMSGFPGFERWRYETLASIRRHGLRFYQATVAAWPGPAIAAHPTPELIREWDERLHRAGLDNVHNWSGSATVHKFVPGLYVGGKLGIVHTPNSARVYASPRVYYVDSIDYDYNAGGSFTTSVSLVRGQKDAGMSLPDPFEGIIS